METNNGLAGEKAKQAWMINVEVSTILVEIPMVSVDVVVLSGACFSRGCKPLLSSPYNCPLLSSPLLTIVDNTVVGKLLHTKV